MVTVRTSREWRRLKRKQVREAIRVVNKLQIGCAFTPSLPQLVKIGSLLDETKRLMSQKNWGK